MTKRCNFHSNAGIPLASSYQGEAVRYAQQMLMHFLQRSRTTTRLLVSSTIKLLEKLHSQGNLSFGTWNPRIDIHFTNFKGCSSSQNSKRSYHSIIQKCFPILKGRSEKQDQFKRILTVSKWLIEFECCDSLALIKLSAL